jgi:hypothetical protein
MIEIKRPRSAPNFSPEGREHGTSDTLDSHSRVLKENEDAAFVCFGSAAWEAVKAKVPRPIG